MDVENLLAKTEHDRLFPGHSGENGHLCLGCEVFVCDDCRERSECQCFDDKPFAMAPLQSPVIHAGV